MSDQQKKTGGVLRDLFHTNDMRRIFRDRRHVQGTGENEPQDAEIYNTEQKEHRKLDLKRFSWHDYFLKFYVITYCITKKIYAIM